MTRPLIHVAEVALGRQRSPEHENGEHVIPYLRSANVLDGALDLTDVKEMNFNPLEQVTFSLRSGDVLVTEGSGSRNTVGTSAVWREELPPPVCFQNTLLRLRPRLGLADGRYLAWWARHAHASGLMAAAASGANILHLSAESLRRLPVPDLDLETQRRIADFLDDQVSRIDNVIEARKTQIELVHESAAHLLVEVAREQGAAEKSAVPWFNAWAIGWSVERLSWLVRCLDGQRIPLNSLERGQRQGDYPYYGASSVIDHIDDYIFDGDYVLVGEDGAALENPRFDVVQRVSGKVWVNNHAHVLEGTGVEPDYLAHYLRCVDRPMLISGATRPKITQEDLLAIPVVVPPADQRKMLTAECEQQRAQIARAVTLLSSSVAALEELKKSLITSAVTSDFDALSSDGSRVPV